MVAALKNLWHRRITQFWPGVKNGIGFRWYWPWFVWSQIEWVENCMEEDINAWAAKCADCKVREPTQNAQAHAKCAGPRKVRGPTQSVRAALWVRGRQKCVGRGSTARAALSARAAIAWRGEWAALPTHFPCTCHAMPTQCNRGSTHVGRYERQSPGTLRVKYTAQNSHWCIFPHYNNKITDVQLMAWCNQAA